LPFLFRKGSYYPWSKEEADKEYWKLTLSLIVGTALALILFIVSIILLRSLLLVLGGMIVTSLIVWVISFFVQNHYKKKTFKITSAVSETTYLVIDLKNQSINYKKENKEIKIGFNQINQLKYSLIYMPFKECAKHNQFILSLEFLTHEDKKVRYYTVFHEKEIPHWSKFLEELPYSIPVLNQK